MADEPVELNAKKLGMIPLLGVAVTIFLNIATGVWFASGMDQRMRNVEGQQINFAHDLGRLDAAREQTNLHMAQLDGQYKNLDDKISAILGIVQQWNQDPPPDGGGGETHTAPQQNFQKPPARR